MSFGKSTNVQWNNFPAKTLRKTATEYFSLQNEKETFHYSLCLETNEENLRLGTMEEALGPFKKMFLIRRSFVLCMTEMYCSV